jgi:hypothetical protein
MKFRYKLLLLPLCVLLPIACSNNTVYPEESFSYDSSFKLRTDGEVGMACDSARRALLGQGYLIVSSTSEGVVGRKAYKIEGKENTFIEMNIVCLPEAAGSTLFATGVLSTYALKMSTSSASVGLSALGSISLPIGQSADSLVKISEETIDDKDFYRRFFAAVDTNLTDLQAGKAVPEPTAPAPAPAPVVPPDAAVQSTEPSSVVTPAPIPAPVPETTPPATSPAMSAPSPAQPAPSASEPPLEPEAEATLPSAPEAPAVTSEVPPEVPEPELAPAQTPPASAVEPPAPVQDAPPVPEKTLRT